MSIKACVEALLISVNAVCGSHEFTRELQKTVGRLENPTNFFKIDSPTHLSSHSKKKSEIKPPVESQLTARALRKLESPVEKPRTLTHKLTTERFRHTRERAGRERTIMAEDIQVVRDFRDKI
jgi:hypothetical protein